jgi:hypothetical protein
MDITAQLQEKLVLQSVVMAGRLAAKRATMAMQTQATDAITSVLSKPAGAAMVGVPPPKTTALPFLAMGSKWVVKNAMMATDRAGMDALQMARSKRVSSA